MNTQEMLQGVKNYIDTQDAGLMYDISEANAESGIPAIYSDLLAALGPSGANVPASVRDGGMSVKFIQQLYTVVKTTSSSAPSGGTSINSDPGIGNGSAYTAADLSAFSSLPTTSSVVYYLSDGESPAAYTVWTISKNTLASCAYVQFRYMGTSTSTGFTTITNWQGVTSEIKYGSKDLVESVAVAEELALGAVYDVSAKNPTAGPNNDGKFTLEYILSHADTLIPTAVRKPGMNIKFAHSVDNKYLQYFCNSQSFTTDVNAWEKMNLEEEVSQLGQGIIGNATPLSLEEYQQYSGMVIKTNGVWVEALQVVQIIFVPISNYEKIQIITTSQPMVFAFLKTNTIESGQMADFATGETGRRELYENSYVEIERPSDAQYLYILATGSNGVSRLSSYAIFTKVGGLIGGLQHEIEVLGNGAAKITGYLGLEYVADNQIKLTSISVVRENGQGSGKIYLNAGHEQELVTVQNVLVLTIDNTITLRSVSSYIQKDDIVLLAYSTSSGCFYGGHLYPSLVQMMIKTTTVDDLNNLCEDENIIVPAIGFDKCLIGSGSQYRAVRFHLEKEKTYIIHLFNPDFNRNGLGESVCLAIRTVTGGSLDPVIYQYHANQVVPSDFEITMPSTTDVIQILIRANVGEQVYFGIKEKAFPAVERGITHLAPDNDGQLNAVKRARQMTDIEWTPSFDIPKLDYVAGDIEEHYASTDLGFYIGDFKAGKKYKGIPYARADKTASQWGYNTFKVGIYIDFETFITAVMNKNSVIDKESEGNVSTHNACFYATVCSAMVCAALGLPYYSTASFPSITGMNSLGLVSVFTLENLKLGDVLVETSIHTAMVTDVIISNGSVQYVEVSEATPLGNDNNNSANIGEEGGEYGGVCRRRWWNRADFLANWGIYTILRYSLINNVTYTPSPYVQIGDEVEQPANHIMALLPYMGNKFTYYVGKIVNNDILINATGFTKLRVTKDGVAWNENGTTDYYDITGLSKISIGFTDLGNYTAYLCNVSGNTETKKSKACSWSVVN